MRWAWVVMLMVGCAHDPAEPLQTPRLKERPPEPTTAPILPATRGDLSPTAMRLASVGEFALGDLGWGSKGQGEELARALAKEPDAIVMFERLLAQPNRPARLYAYWALRTLDADRANHHRAELERDSTKVRTMYSDLAFDKPTSVVVAEIDRLPKL